MTHVTGIHHITAIASDPQRNLDFYSGLLGLRLVKCTVNFDDPYTYHFYFGDEVGSPGSLMTSFPWPGARGGRQGSGQVAVTSFAVVPEAIGFWIERLIRYNVRYQGPSRRHVGAESKNVLAFTDHDGLMLEIVGHPGAERRPVWRGAPGIPREYAIHGLHGITLWVEDRGAHAPRVVIRPPAQPSSKPMSRQAPACSQVRAQGITSSRSKGMSRPVSSQMPKRSGSL